MPTDTAPDIAAICEAYGLTRVDLAALLGIDKVTLYRYGKSEGRKQVSVARKFLGVLDSLRLRPNVDVVTIGAGIRNRLRRKDPSPPLKAWLMVLKAYYARRKAG